MYGGYEGVIWLVLLIATATDLLRGKIYNVLTFPVLFIGIFVRLFVEGTDSVHVTIPAVILIFVVGFPLYWLKIFGAGDVKLLMALAAWTDFAFALHLGALSIMIGAAVGVVVMFQKRFLGSEQKTPDIEPITQGGYSVTRMAFAPAFMSAFLIIKIFEVYRWDTFF